MTERFDVLSKFHSLLVFVLVFAIVLLFVFYAKEVYVLFKFIDRGVTALLAPLAKFVGATERPFDTREKWIRRFKILAFFGPLLALCVFLITREPDPWKIWSYVELVVVAALYLTALSIAKQWLANEGKLFDLEETRDDEESGVVANHLKRVAMLSIFVVMVCVPISLHAFDHCLNPGVELGDFDEYSILSLGLLADSILNLGSLLNLDTAKGEWFEWIVFFHVIVLTFIVVEGFAMMARGDYAKKLALKSLIEEGDTKKVIPFGERVVVPLAQILMDRRNPVGPKNDLRTAPRKRRNSADAATALGNIAILDRELTSGITDQLERVALGHGNRPESVRQASVEALYRIGLAEMSRTTGEEKSKLLGGILQTIRRMAFEKKVGVGVKSAAVIGLRELGGITNQSELNQVGEMMETYQGSVPFRRAAASCISVHPHVPLQANARVIGILKRLHVTESNARVRRDIAGALMAVAPAVFEDDLLHHSEILGTHSDPQVRASSATLLGDSIRNDVARLSLIKAVNDDSEVVQRAVAEALGCGEEIGAKSKRGEIIKALKVFLDPNKVWNVQTRAIWALGNYRFDPQVQSVLSGNLRQRANGPGIPISVIDATTKTLAQLDAYEELIDLLDVTEFQVHPSAQQALRSWMRTKDFSREIHEEIESILDGLDAESTIGEEKAALKQLISEAETEKAEEEELETESSEPEAIPA